MAIVPTVGRKMYYRPNGFGNFTQFDDQPLDATVLWVDPTDTNSVCLSVIDHAGCHSYHSHVPVVQPEEITPVNTGYVEWVPYQVAQEQTKAKGDFTGISGTAI